MAVEGMVEDLPIKVDSLEAKHKKLFDQYNNQTKELSEAVTKLHLANGAIRDLDIKVGNLTHQYNEVKSTLDAKPNWARLMFCTQLVTLFVLGMFSVVLGPVAFHYRFLGSDACQSMVGVGLLVMAVTTFVVNLRYEV